MQADVVIVGAGQAGAECAIHLRQNGFAGSILIVGDEPDLPYERPPLSKEYLSGEKAFDRLHIRPLQFWSDNRVDFLLGRSAKVVQVDAHTLVLDDGLHVGYGQLVWAAGGEPRKLTCSGHDLQGVHYVRRRADVDKLTEELGRASKIVVVGGGYIGLEAAAVMAKLDKAVTIVEAQDRVLSRVAGEPLSRFFEAEHRQHGVTILLQVAVECIEGGAVVTGVRLADGTLLPADIVIVGVGIIPNIDPLETAGAHVANGVIVDAQCRTSLADVYAIGDCAAHRNDYSPFPAIRLESVQNAADQAAVVGKVISGGEASYGATPWFWSNQYDIRLQTVGLAHQVDEMVVRGDMADKKFSVIYLREGRVVALDCVNMPKDYVQGRKLIESQVLCSPRHLANPDIPLKSLIPAA